MSYVKIVCVWGKIPINATRRFMDEWALAFLVLDTAISNRYLLDRKLKKKGFRSKRSSAGLLSLAGPL